MHSKNTNEREREMEKSPMYTEPNSDVPDD